MKLVGLRRFENPYESTRERQEEIKKTNNSEGKKKIPWGNFKLPDFNQFQIARDK